MLRDPHSYSRPQAARVTHLHWKAKIDFANKIIYATASWTIKANADVNTITFDTKELRIDGITFDEDEPAVFRLGERDPLLGQALIVDIKSGVTKINIVYQTSSDAEALQWLTPEQTSGKKYPFLFTQSQAILARSWVPCQDSPGVRFTYEAEVTVPDPVLPLMSATNPQSRNKSGIYYFEMKQPIPSYLFALVAGDIEFKSVSGRSGIYAEPHVLSDAVWEFVDLEKMIGVAEELYGSYPWERYDVIVLPPSFPFGGMENPRLTFATPTILAGDRSLTSLIAHELAHSWSGNLVTNATWNDFWLNEGFTVYFEHRIMEELYGKDYAEMLAVLALQDLRDTIATLQSEGKDADTRLKLDLEGRSPDDGVTDIAYNKGYFFLRYLEEKYGREKFDSFLNHYFKTNAFMAIDTDAFVKSIKVYYQIGFNLILEDLDFTAWIFTGGLPDNCPQPVSAILENVDKLILTWSQGIADNSCVKSWSTHEWLHFLKNLPDPLSEFQMKTLDEFGNFTASGNAEIVTLWLVKVIRYGYKPGFVKLEQFLINTGRRKFLTPLYGELAKTTEGKRIAAEIYRRARPNYHFVATNTVDKVFN
jgi:leukotriene-A4 hydrolase